jgi:hypothetical protein
VFRNILLLRALTLHLKKHFLPDQYQVKGLIVTLCIGWKNDNEDDKEQGMRNEDKEKSGRWTTAKDAPQPKGLTLYTKIPENTDEM